MSAFELQERGNTNAKFWSASILEALGGEQRWYQVALRQLSGMLLLVFARTSLKVRWPHTHTNSQLCAMCIARARRRAGCLRCPSLPCRLLIVQGY